MSHVRNAARPHRLSRRLLLGGGAGAALATLLPGSWAAVRSLAAADGPEPLPLPGGVRNAHVYAPGPAAPVATINDFTGVVGVADLLGSGTGYLADGSAETLAFRIENRFMLGRYRATDGQLYDGAFAEL